MVKTPDEASYMYAKKSFMAYLEEGRFSEDKKAKSLTWIIGIIRASGVRGPELQLIFHETVAYGDPKMHQLVMGECQQHGWL